MIREVLFSHHFAPKKVLGAEKKDESVNVLKESKNSPSSAGRVIKRK